MTYARLAYGVRCQLAREQRAKGPAKRIAERAEAVARLNLFIERYHYTPLWADARVILQSTERMH